MPKSWSCAYCNQPVSELGSFVKIAGKSYAHLPCYGDAQYNDGMRDGRMALQKEQAAEKIAAYERERVALNEEFATLPRCTRCGKKITDSDKFEFLGDVTQPSSAAGVCAPCVREEVRARAAARGSQAPASATRPVEPPAPKEPEPKKDRIQLLDLD